MKARMSLPLTQAWPNLNSIPRAPLAALPTPINRYPLFAQQHHMGSLTIKHDSQTNTLYGGNKVRKLEFLLGQAVAKQASHIMTVGYAGSNFCLAASIYAQQLGLRNQVFLLPQINTKAVQRNLLLNHAAGAELHHYPNQWRLIAGVLQTLVSRPLRRSLRISAGGSDPLGILGFVNAAYELHEQVSTTQQAMPDCIYLPLGSMGSVAGLAIGLAALGLDTRIICAQVVPKPFASQKSLQNLIQSTLKMLQHYCPKFPIKVNHSQQLMKQITIREDFFGAAYGDPSNTALTAAKTAETELELTLDTTYSAKSFANLLHDAANQQLAGQNVLFWNTYNNQPADALADRLANRDGIVSEHPVTINDLDYHALPKTFWHYFETPTKA